MRVPSLSPSAKHRHSTSSHSNLTSHTTNNTQQAFRIARPGFRVTDCLPRTISARAGADPGRLLTTFPRGCPVRHIPCPPLGEGGRESVVVSVKAGDEEAAADVGCV